jgi:carbonic anhydrase
VRTPSSARIVSATVMTLILVGLAGVAAAQEDGAGSGHWSYEGVTGPTSWGSLEPDFATCAEGTSQSPVDIPGDAPVNPDDVIYDYRDTAVTIANNGHAIQVDHDQGSSARIDGTDYALRQFHFHSPIEHAFAGENKAMEMHLVHADLDGDLAVIGVLLVEGAMNPAFDPIFENMPVEEGEPVTVEGVFVDMDDLLPEDRSYYGYEGSLTTPPCTEGVLWHMLARPVAVSADQLATVRAIYDGNNRPVQPMNDREFQRP